MDKQPQPKKAWTKPEIQAIQINEAQGQNPVPLCDKHGALSNGCGDFGNGPQ